jgi:predicted nucleic acid-binding protein
MKVLVDLNVWLDIALRQQQYPDSAKCLRVLEENNAQICFPALGYTTLVYLIEKFLDKKAAMSFTDFLLLQRVAILGFAEQEIIKAKQLKFKDHEDACVGATALLNRCDFIISRNEKDFINSPIKLLTPTRVIEKYIDAKNA